MNMSFIAQKSEQAKLEQQRNASENTRGSYSTVTLIGPDGSGKTAVAKALLERCPLPLKYLYMGTSIESSNVALPTSRLVHKWKVYQHKKSLQRSGKTIPEKITLHGPEHRVETRGKLGACGRLLRRVSEESYRQLHSWIYQLRGNVVLYDRHFLFDACPPPSDTGKHRFTDQVHNWFLRRIYPRPGLGILLDAPAEVLYARKPEVSVEDLERDRLNLVQKSCYAKEFVTVDATKPLDEVIDIVNSLILDYCSKQHRD